MEMVRAVILKQATDCLIVLVLCLTPIPGRPSPNWSKASFQFKVNGVYSIQEDKYVISHTFEGIPVIDGLRLAQPPQKHFPVTIEYLLIHH